MKTMVAIYLIAFVLTATGSAGHASGFAWPQAEAVSLIANGLAMPLSNCGIINLEEYAGQSGTNPDHQPCAYACAHSNTLVFVPQMPGTQYNWSVSGGTFIPGANPAEIIVTWGTAGTGSITLTRTTGNAQLTLNLCIEILASPVANFTKSATTICAGGQISFTNTSTGANQYFWDFDDGQTSTAFSPTHTFQNPGVYTVCLIATRDHVDAYNRLLCSCTDTLCMDVVVESLPGPEIACVSTLCAGDSTKYWTDASNCGSYQWTVLDHNGMPVSFTGQGSDSISVIWGSGPFGTVSLLAMNCDSVYCSVPSTVTIPIIAPLSIINGPVVACANESATYTLPKWPGVQYQWMVTGGAILSGQGFNVVVIQWGSGGTGTITVNYDSPFLSTLPGHSPPDCSGTAGLTIQIKPAFSLQALPAVVCQNSNSGISATPSGAYNWSVSPTQPFTGQGSNGISVNWLSAGSYNIVATPVNPLTFCNASASTNVQVLSVSPPDSISGPHDICPGASNTYLGFTGQPGTVLNWTVTGGTPSSATGTSISVTWNPVGPYGLSLTQSLANAPGCISSPVTLAITPRQLAGPLAISGPPGCTNSTQPYLTGPAQHPDAYFQWSIFPASAGSVISGQGTPAAAIQWNNTPGNATLNLTVSLCGNSISDSIPISLFTPPVPVITQTGVLCPPSGTATLQATPGFASYAWSTGASTSSISINMAGTYVLTVTDNNNCQSAVAWQAVAASAPVAAISTGSPTTLCIAPPNPPSVTLVAQTGAGYSFEWFSNAVSQGMASPNATFVHNNTNAPGIFSYQVVVTGGNGCTASSNFITITQDSCLAGPGEPCVPNPYTLAFNAVNQNPVCNVVDFSVNASPSVVLSGWNFGDSNSNTNTGTLFMAQHTYTQAGCYLVVLSGSVPGMVGNTQTTCQVQTAQSICIPVAANFTYSSSCLKVNFAEACTFLPGESISSWAWNFGDGNNGSGPTPMHTYSMPGTYNVTLTAVLASGCTAVITQPVMVVGLATPVISISPSPACVGQPVAFGATLPGNILNQLWNFGNGSTNGGQNPSHAYLMPGNYNVSLSITDAQGCTAIGSQTLVVHPAPPQDTIAYSPSLTVCAGQSVTLTAPAGAGYTYLWSDNSTGASLVVTAAGTYGVTVTNSFGCDMIPAPVTVVILPGPNPVISGNPVICGAGCTTLSAPPGFNYQWLDPVAPLPGQIFSSINICDFNLPTTVAVAVTDVNGCTAVSPPVTVSVAAAPSFAVTASGACEGTPVTLNVTPVQVNVVYTWNTGSMGSSLTVIQAGTYTAVGVDTLNGCRSSASATIHPLPDLCMVPLGCYKTCALDTICGPPGLSAYQWLLNGAPIPGETAACLIVTQNGDYTLEGTNAFGCKDTSNVLKLELMECGCDGLEIEAEAVAGDTCCWSLNLSNNYPGTVAGFSIQTQDADFVFDLSGLDPALQVVGVSPGGITLTGSMPFGSPIPLGQLSGFLSFCFQNVQNSPQTVVINWFDETFEVICSDSLLLECPVEPDCLYMVEDSIACDGADVAYTFTVCNPIDAAFSVGYILLQPVLPSGISVSPPGLTVSPAIAPGECRTFTVNLLGGTSIFGETFCYRLLAHDFDPEVVDTALCCALDTLYCIDIPDCEPCDDIAVDVHSSGNPDSGDCCFGITISNNYQPDYFDGINLCLITPGASFVTLNNFLGSGWATINYSSTLIALDAIPPLGNTIPLGQSNLPSFCIQTAQFANPLLEIKWMRGDSVVCRDTVSLACLPPCGYFSAEEVVCNANGTWNYTGTFHNSSAYTLNALHFVVTSPGGMAGYNQSYTGLSLSPGSTYNFNFPLGSPAIPGDSVCFTIGMRDTMNVECCNIYNCILLPDCGPGDCVDSTLINLNEPCPVIFEPVCGCDGITYPNPCVAENYHGLTSWTAGPCPDNPVCTCGDLFQEQALQGFTPTPLPSPPASPLSYRFTPRGDLQGCDRITWRYRRLPINPLTPVITAGITIGDTPFDYTFPADGVYQVCMRVERLDDNGETCVIEVCAFLNVFTQMLQQDEDWVSIAPNPTEGDLFILPLEPWSGQVYCTVRDVYGRVKSSTRLDNATYFEAFRLDMTAWSPGIYWLEVFSAGQKKVFKVIRQ